MSVYSPKVLETLKNLRLIDDAFFSVAFNNNVPLAQYVLKCFIPDQSLTVTHVVTQKETKNLYGHSTRLDILAKDNAGKLYNIEIQRRTSGASPKRARYYAAMLDTSSLQKGQDYDDLPETYIIFLTQYDALKNDKQVYHINRTVEETNSPFKDDCHILYINSKKQDDTPLGRLLRDFYCTDSKNAMTPIIAQTLSQFKESKEGENIMCDAIEKLQKESYEKGIEKGIDKGRFLMIKQLMDVDHLSLTEAMDKFRLTEPERANMLRVYESMNSPNG